MRQCIFNYEYFHWLSRDREYPRHQTLIITGIPTRTHVLRILQDYVVLRPFYGHSSIVFTQISHEFREFKMSAKKTTQKTNKPASGDFKGFVNVHLSDDEKQVISETWETGEWGEIVTELVGYGKLSISFNETNQTYSATISFSGLPALQGVALSSFAPSPLMALYVTAFKIGTKWDEIISTEAGKPKASFG